MMITNIPGVEIGEVVFEKVGEGKKFFGLCRHTLMQGRLKYSARPAANDQKFAQSPLPEIPKNA